MLCIQYKAAAPGSVNPSDGTILNAPVKWCERELSPRGTSVPHPVRFWFGKAQN